VECIKGVADWNLIRENEEQKVQIPAIWKWRHRFAAEGCRSLAVEFSVDSMMMKQGSN